MATSTVNPASAGYRNSAVGDSPPVPVQDETLGVSLLTVTHQHVEGLNDAPRDVWGNKIQFLLSCIGYAVGLGNVWRFPYLCYKNGGGTFLIPYTIMLLIEGIPLFFLELSLGQYMQKSAYGSLTAISPVLGGVAIATLFTSFFVGLYYTVIISWTLLYMFKSFTSKLPWDGYTCDANATTGPGCTDVVTENYWYHEALHSTTSIDDMGTVQYQLVLALLLAWVVICLCEIKGIQSAGYVVYFTATFPYIVLIALFFRGITLSGADEGIKFYLKPDLNRLGDAQIWLDAASQILYSLSPGFGSLITFASFNKRHNDTLKDSIMVCLINCGTSVFAGFAIFSILGHMAHVRGIAVDQVVEQGPGLAFIAYPQALLEIDGSVFWTVSFFFMLFLLGLDSMFGTVESIVTILEDLGWKPERKSLAPIAVCSVSFVCGLIMTSQAGVYIFELFDQYSAAVPLMCIVFCELIAVAWIYGADKFVANIEFMTNRKLSRWWWYVWKWVTPIILAFILVWNFINEIMETRTYATAEGLREFPQWAVFCGWCLIMSSVLWIPAVAIYHREKIHIGWKDVVENVTWARFISECYPHRNSHVELDGKELELDTLATGGVNSNDISTA